MCVGSNPSPVRTSFRRDEGDFPADEVPYTKKRVGLNANPFKFLKRMTPTVQQIRSLNSKVYQTEIALVKSKFSASPRQDGQAV